MTFVDDPSATQCTVVDISKEAVLYTVVGRAVQLVGFRVVLVQLDEYWLSFDPQMLFHRTRTTRFVILYFCVYV